jgi:transposase
MKKRFIGLDVHKRVVEVCAIDPKGKVLFRCRLGTAREELERFAKKRLRRTDGVALESTTNTWAVVAVLRPFVADIVVSNPLKTKAIAEAKIKTDKVDALVLAQLLRCDYLPSVWIPSEEVQELRQLTGRRASLVGDRTAIKNRISSALAQRLLVPPVKDLFSAEGRRWLGDQVLDEPTRAQIDSDLRLLDSVDQEVLGSEDALYRRAYQQPEVRLLVTLPGVDVTVAQALLAAWGDPARFRDADHAVSYLGLVPSTKQSAGNCYHGPITKQGNRKARTLLVQAAQHLPEHPGPLGAFMRRLLRKKNRNVAVVAGARKLAVIAWHMLKAKEPYRYALPERTRAKLARLRTRGGGKRRKPGATGPRPHYGSGARTRTVRGIHDVYLAEELPTTTPIDQLPSGERAHLRRARVEPFRPFNPEDEVRHHQGPETTKEDAAGGWGRDMKPGPNGVDVLPPRASPGPGQSRRHAFPGP